MECIIKIFDLAGTFLGVIDDAESVVLDRNHRGVGSFQVDVSAGKQGASTLAVRDRVIVINDNGRKSGIVRDIQLSENSDGAKLTIWGDTLGGLAKQRITVPPTEAEKPGSYGWDRTSGNGEDVIHYYARRHMISPTNSSRRIANLTAAASQHAGASTPWQTRYEPLSKVLEDVAEYCDLGWGIYLDFATRGLIFEVVPGRNLTVGSGGGSPVIFCTAFDNLTDVTYKESVGNFANTGYAGGQGEDENRLIQTLYPANAGIARWETFLDCGSSENISELLYYGYTQLDSFKLAKTIEGAVAPDTTFTFEKDYFLGDKVTIRFERAGLYADARITGASERWDSGGYGLELRFGEKTYSTLTMIKNATYKNPVK